MVPHHVAGGNNQLIVHQPSYDCVSTQKAVAIS